MPFKKGNCANPKGRPPIILPEVTKLIDQTRNTARVMIIQKLNPDTLSAYLDAVISQGAHEGDVQKLKILLELALGKMVKDEPEFPVSEEEKALVLEYRHKKALFAAGQDIGLDVKPE